MKYNLFLRLKHLLAIRLTAWLSRFGFVWEYHYFYVRSEKYDLLSQMYVMKGVSWDTARTEGLLNLYFQFINCKGVTK